MNRFLVNELRCYRDELRPARLRALAAHVAHRAWRAAMGWKNRGVTLSPQGPSRGRVLSFYYRIDPFQVPDEQSVSYDHTILWESLRMARTFQELGYTVDVIHWARNQFTPRYDYDFYVDLRRNFERIAVQLPGSCRKILHIDTAHCGFHNAAQRRRLEELARRRGIELPPYKLIEVNRAIEHADCATILGNEFTMGTYRFADKPLHRIPISAPFQFPFPDRKDFAAAGQWFLWFGNDGFVHKGLDRVLEVFAGLPDLHLVVCGPLENELKFKAAYYRELYQTPNIHTEGWVDIGTPRFLQIANRCAGLIYPSCSEGGGGSVINCMHAGVIPIASREASVDLNDAHGMLLPDGSLESIRHQVQAFARRSPESLRAMARNAWAFARSQHSRAHFAAAYRRFVEEQIAAHRGNLR